MSFALHASQDTRHPQSHLDLYYLRESALGKRPSQAEGKQHKQHKMQNNILARR